MSMAYRLRVMNSATLLYTLLANTSYICLHVYHSVVTYM